MDTYVYVIFKNRAAVLYRDLNVLLNSLPDTLIREESLEIYLSEAEKIELLHHIKGHMYLYHIYRYDKVMIFFCIFLMNL